MKLKKFMALAMAATLAMASLAGCGSGSSSGSNETADDGNTVYLGVISPNTGNLAQYGESITNGIKLAIKEINEAGGVLGGKTLAVKSYMDDKADASESANCFNKLLEEGVSAILGSATSGVTQGLAELADESGMLLLTPTATADSITPGKATVFRACFKDSFQGEMAAKFAKELGITKVAVLYASGDAYSAGLYDSFAEACDTYGLDLVAVESSANTDDTDYTTQLTNIAASDAELLFVPYYYDSVGPYIVPQARAAGYDGVIMGADGWDGVSDPEYLTGDLDDYNNCYFTNHYSSDDPSEMVQNFVAAYNEEYSKAPTALAALAYDCIYMLVQAMEDAGSADTAAMIEAMTGMTFEGVGGKFTLDEDNTPRKSVAIIEIVDGEFVYNSTLSPE